MSNPKRARLTKRDILDEFDNPLSSDEENCVAVDSDDREVDHVEEEIHLPDEEDAEMAPTSPSSPQDMSECDDKDNTPLGNVFYSKDKLKRVMKWNKCPLDPSKIRTRVSNIVLRLPGPREVYVAKQPPGPFNVSQSAEDVTIRICELVTGTNRNITMDNWFTTIPLAEKLFEENS
ncbi:hypothetical protein J6590_100660 [Homalodisca vitripennis]|nr:hypothetical protein J6590_100660 [Homalodisca vitripennis]